MKKLLLLFVCLAITLGGVACTREDGEQRPSRRGAQGEKRFKTLVINLGDRPKTLDPLMITGTLEHKVLLGLMEGLVVIGEHEEAQPGVAERWEANEDYTEWTFHLREDAKWHNGEPVTAHDFVYGIRRILTPSTAAQYASNVEAFLKGGAEFYAAGGMESDHVFSGVEALDDRTLVYRLMNPTPFFATVISFASWLPVNQKAVEEGGRGWADNPATFLGNGAFRISEHRSGDRIIAVKSDNYWDKDEIFWEEIHYLMISDQNTMNSAYLSDEIDVTNTVPIPEIDYWKDRPDFYAPPGLATYYVGFNSEKAPFDDPRVRRAFSLAIDKDLIVNRILRRGEKPSRGLIPHAMPSPRDGVYTDYAPDFIGKMNVEEAKRLLAEAGYGDGGRPLPPLEYLYNTADEHKIVSEQLQGMWSRAFGVDVRLQNVEWGVFLSRRASGDFMFGRSSWVADYADPMSFLEIFESTNAQNHGRYNIPEFDALVAQARVERDPVKREDLMIEAERILVQEHAALAPIYTYSLAVLVKPDIEGLRYNSMANLLYVRAKRVESAQ